LQRAALNAIEYLANKLGGSIVADGIYEAFHVMRSDSQIASRLERHALPDWTASQELRRFIAGHRADGAGALQALATFSTNPAGAAIVNAVGPIRQIVHGDARAARRYLVIVAGYASQPGSLVRLQAQ
jgi:Bacterial TniB protein